MYTEEGILISELAKRSGTTVRTIRYYIQEGLLPQPDIRGRYSVYDQKYLERLELIKRLKDAYLPLKEIKRLINSLDDHEIQALLALDANDFNQQITKNSISEMRYIAEEPSDALTYIARILDVHSDESDATGAAPPPQRTRRPPEPRPYEPRRESQWQRIEILPGLELHVRQHILTRYKGHIEKAVQYITDLFKNKI